MEKLRVIGASWCPDCKRAKVFLGQHRIAYDWVDMENNDAAIAEVERLNDGKRSIPTIVFPDGIGGAELAERFTLQAKRYGVEILQAVRVETFTANAMGIDITTSTNQMIQARALVVATGSTYRRTEAIGEEDLIGAGIHFCATCDGPFYKGAKELVVLGGGNSGLEEGLFLTQFADHVTVIERGSSLKGSKLLQEKVLNHPKMEVRLNLGVKEFKSTEGGKLRSVILEDIASGNTFEHAADGAFIFIGLDPNTGWLPSGIDKDERGFVKTDLTFRTSITGVFAAGDVRAGSTKQLASAVGEGAAAAIQIRYYLDSVS